MSKYAVGDKARVLVSNAWCSGVKEGQVVTISGLRALDPSIVDVVDDNGNTWGLSAIHHLEKVESPARRPVEGDWVLYVGEEAEEVKAYQVGPECPSCKGCVPLPTYYDEDGKPGWLTRHALRYEVILLIPESEVPVRPVETTEFEVGHWYKRDEDGYTPFEVLAVNGPHLWIQYADEDEPSTFYQPSRANYKEIKES